MKKSLLLAGLSLPFVINNILTAVEKRNNPPPGKMVDVNGEKMHVYTTGHGKDTVVLLPGWGTPCPLIDFSPLIRMLSNDYKVVVVEPFGYGWSDRTKKSRTVENIVEEIRKALVNAGIKGPYILMPHSMSGIHSLYYANKYPSEVKAIAGIDITPKDSVDYFNKYISKSFPKYLSLLGPIGVSRAVLSIKPTSSMPSNSNSIYTKQEYNLMKKQFIWNGYNKTVITEINELINNLNKIHKITLPKNTPIILFISKHTATIPINKETLFIDAYRNMINSLNKGKIVQLNGSHYLHHKNSKKMKEHLVEFLK